MNYLELRQYLATFEDTPENRTELRRMLIVGEADEVTWGYAEYNVEGFQEWYENWRTSLQEAIQRHRSGEETFAFTDLAGATIRRTKLNRAELYRANLKSADLRRINLSGADLEDANLEDTNLMNADLRQANLMNAKLRRANLMNAKLRGTDFNDTDLRDADLRGADLSTATLLRADLDGTDLTGATYNMWTIFPEGFDPEAAGMEFIQTFTVHTFTEQA